MFKLHFSYKGSFHYQKIFEDVFTGNEFGGSWCKLLPACMLEVIAPLIEFIAPARATTSIINHNPITLSQVRYKVCKLVFYGKAKKFYSY